MRTLLCRPRRYGASDGSARHLAAPPNLSAWGAWPRQLHRLFIDEQHHDLRTRTWLVGRHSIFESVSRIAALEHRTSGGCDGGPIDLEVAVRETPLAVNAICQRHRRQNCAGGCAENSEDPGAKGCDHAYNSSPELSVASVIGPRDHGQTAHGAPVARKWATSKLQDGCAQSASRTRTSVSSRCRPIMAARRSPSRSASASIISSCSATAPAHRAGPSFPMYRTRLILA